MHLIFDLDGTLTDPFTGITGCIQHALASVGRPSPPLESLGWCIGPPLRASLATLLCCDDELLVEEALTKYRERFSSTGLFENEVYPGIKSLLSELQRDGHHLYIATSKPTVFATRIVKHFGMTPFFRSINGCEFDGTRSEKASLIAHVLECHSIEPKSALMIGDRKHDIVGAKHNGVPGIGVLWGYGTREELEEAGANACVGSVEALLEFIQQSINRMPLA